MKKNLLLLSLLALLSLGFVSCSDDDDDNGGSSSNLAGIWCGEKIYADGQWVNFDDVGWEYFVVFNKNMTFTSYSFELDEKQTLALDADDNEIETGKYSVKGKKLTMIYDDDDDDEDYEEESTYSLKDDNLTITLDDEEGDEYKIKFKRYSEDEFNLAMEKLKVCGAWMYSGEEKDEYVFFMPDGYFLMATTVKDWSWGKTPMPVRTGGTWHFSDGKLQVTLSEGTTTMTYELDEYWVELTLNGKTYDRENTSIVEQFMWVGDK